MRLFPIVTLIAAIASHPSSIAAQQLIPPRWGRPVGFHAGSPAIVSVGVGVSRVFGRSEQSIDRGHALFALVEPGVNAGRTSFGYAYEWGNLGTFLTVRATGLRRWRNASANYLGGEVSAHLLGLGPRVGVFRAMDGDGEGETRMTFDFGFGF